MKTKFKGLLLSLCAVTLIAASVFGTMAYLTATDKAVNTFTVGSVKIKLDEADVTPDGKYVTDHDNRVKENEYHLMPGHEYIKDPTVTVLKGSEKSYVRMIVTINGLTDELRNLELKMEDVFGGVSDKWKLANEYNTDTAGTGRAYEFRYNEIAAALEDEDLVLDDLFETLTVPGEIDADGLAALGHVNIVVEAHAIQADGFANADEAWAAFDGENK